MKKMFKKFVKKGGKVLKNLKKGRGAVYKFFMFVSASLLILNATLVSVFGVQPQPQISINTINGQQPPFNFTCPDNPLESPVTITGSGSSSAPPGQIDQYKVQVDWGDGTIQNGLGVFIPSSGQGPFVFSFSAGPHQYSSGGNKIIKARLYHSQPPGNDNQADSVATIEVCIVVEPTCVDNDQDSFNAFAEGLDCDPIDCNDGDAGINPGAEEVCDQIDNNCNELIDEGDVCEVPAECGNNIWEEGEQCDNGGANIDNADPVWSFDQGEGDRSYCSTSCDIYYVPGLWCGDGSQNGQEECDGDDGVTEGYSCSEECTLVQDSFECRIDLDVMIVMDTSGSMDFDEPTRLSQAQSAANNFIANLGAGDQSGLVSFAGEPNPAPDAILVKTLSNNHSSTQSSISGLTALGGTNIGDGIVDVNNNYSIQGSGDPASFILVISMNPSVSVSAPAVYAANNSQSIIFAALHGMLKVKNNGSLNAAVAEVLYLEPNSQVTFNPFLVAFYIPNGGGEAVGTALGSWQEL